MAIMEIKRPNYKGVGKRFQKVLDPDKVPGLVADDPQNWNVIDRPEYPTFPAMGVVCLREHENRDRSLDEKIDAGHVVVVLNVKGNKIEVNPEAAWRLINFLMMARLRARLWDGFALANIDAIQPNE